MSALGFGGIVFALVKGRIQGWLVPRESGWAQDWPVAPVALSLGVGMLGLVSSVLAETNCTRQNLEVVLGVSLFRAR